MKKLDDKRESSERQLNELVKQRSTFTKRQTMQRNSGADEHSMSEMRSTPESTGNSRPDGKRDRAQRWQSRNDPGGQTKNLKRKNSMKTIRLN